MRLPDDAEVSNDLWDEVIDCIKVRVGDKVQLIRTFSVRALSRFANDAENSDILELLLEKLPLEQNPVSFRPIYYNVLLYLPFDLLIMQLLPNTFCFAMFMLYMALIKSKYTRYLLLSISVFDKYSS